MIYFTYNINQFPSISFLSLVFLGDSLVGLYVLFFNKYNFLSTYRFLLTLKVGRFVSLFLLFLGEIVIFLSFIYIFFNVMQPMSILGNSLDNLSFFVGDFKRLFCKSRDAYFLTTFFLGENFYDSVASNYGGIVWGSSFQGSILSFCRRCFSFGL